MDYFPKKLLIIITNIKVLHQKSFHQGKFKLFKVSPLNYFTFKVSSFVPLFGSNLLLKIKAITLSSLHLISG